MAATREAGFGDEVKRRIILGTHVLSAGFFDAYYGNAQKVQTLIQRDFARVFDEVDVLVSPTCPTTAFRFGKRWSIPWRCTSTTLRRFRRTLQESPQ